VFQKIINEIVLYVILFIVISIWTYMLLHMTLSGLEASTKVILWDSFKFLWCLLHTRHVINWRPQWQVSSVSQEVWCLLIDVVFIKHDFCKLKKLQKKLLINIKSTKQSTVCHAAEADSAVTSTYLVWWLQSRSGTAYVVLLFTSHASSGNS
jgi:hypothetical protein